ncbi:hypothetical protein GCM10009710_09330 [Aeromicrobium alkaliterrae]|uniref:Restriction endonuclease domain-containing protein n=1 Tax=Aeromicrobium alkaliterrae TaxID=302168 RepID=A0ABP4VLG5_9ACTN
MTVMTTSGTIPRGPFTVDDLESFPDDGNRYEIIDGLLIVSPSSDRRCWRSRCSRRRPVASTSC